MSPQHPDDDERKLSALFDQTATPPSADALARMARKAALVPEARRPWYRRMSRPLFAGTAVALAAAAALALYLRAERDPIGPVASGGPSATEAAPARDDDDDALLAFDLGVADAVGARATPLDADPAAIGADNDHPLAALELLFSAEDDEIELLDAALSELVPEDG